MKDKVIELLQHKKKQAEETIEFCDEQLAALESDEDDDDNANPSKSSSSKKAKGGKPSSSKKKTEDDEDDDSDSESEDEESEESEDEDSDEESEDEDSDEDEDGISDDDIREAIVGYAKKKKNPKLATTILTKWKVKKSSALTQKQRKEVMAYIKKNK